MVDRIDSIDELDGALEDLELALAHDAAVDQGLEQAGIEARALDRRASALGAGAAGAGSILQFPPWIRNWEVQLAAASGGYHDVWLSLDVWGLPAAVRLKIEPRRSGAGAGSIVVSWAADFYEPAGLVLELFRKGDPEERPAFACQLGSKVRGTLALTAGTLGFDQTTTPFQCRLRRP